MRNLLIEQLSSFRQFNVYLDNENETEKFIIFGIAKV